MADMPRAPGPATVVAPGHDDIPEIALGWLRDDGAVALATVVETWGSAPRPVGAQLAIGRSGEMAGSVSGGCVEGAVVVEALDMLAAAPGAAPGHKVLDFGVSDDEAFAVGLACGGRIRVLVEVVPAGDTVLDELVAARAARRPVAVVTDLETGAHRLAGPGDFPERFRADRSGIEPDGRSFVAVHNPPLRLAIVGAVHIAQPLVPMARACGFDPVLIDPRESFASAARFPGEKVLHDWPDEALAALAPDARTAVVTLTHDPKLDDPAIRAALESSAFYLGCLGSKRTHARRLDRLRAAGLGEDALARIHAPVGLDIGARTPAEIAVAIMAEIVRVLRG